MPFRSFCGGEASGSSSTERVAAAGAEAEGTAPAGASATTRGVSSADAPSLTMTISSGSTGETGERGASSAGSPLPGFFFRFLEPGAFLREWVRPDSDSLCDRARRLCLSESLVGRIGMTLSSVYDSLH